MDPRIRIRTKINGSAKLCKKRFCCYLTTSAELINSWLGRGHGLEWVRLVRKRILGRHTRLGFRLDEEKICNFLSVLRIRNDNSLDPDPTL
jgi:hypothetical protein